MSMDSIRNAGFTLSECWRPTAETLGMRSSIAIKLVLYELVRNRVKEICTCISYKVLSKYFGSMSYEQMFIHSQFEEITSIINYFRMNPVDNNRLARIPEMVPGQNLQPRHSRSASNQIITNNRQMDQVSHVCYVQLMYTCIKSFESRMVAEWLNYLDYQSGHRRFNPCPECFGLDYQRRSHVPCFTPACYRTRGHNQQWRITPMSLYLSLHLLGRLYITIMWLIICTNIKLIRLL